MGWLNKWIKKIEKKNQRQAKELKKVWEKILTPTLPPREVIAPISPSEGFFQSKEWQRLRYKAIKKYGRVCMACGISAKEIHVDHVKPRSKYPELALVLTNLQVLCRDCNLGKGNWDETDWRRKKI